MADTVLSKTDAPQDFREEAERLWKNLPNKALFGVLFLGWLALFHGWGNATLGYVHSSSLFLWMNNAYQNSADDEHGYVVPIIVLIILWLKRDELTAISKRVWWPAMALLVFSAALHLFGYLVQQTRISIVAFFLGLYALTGLAWGWKWLRVTIFPFMLFAFCVPLSTQSEFITFPLREMATKITVGLAHVLGLEVVRSGTSIIEPGGRYRYEVAAACSGIRSLTAITGIALTYSFLGFKTHWRRGVLLAASIPLAVAGNVLRLFVIIIAAEIFGESAGSYVHASTVFSLLPYIPAMAGLALIGRWLRERAAGGDLGGPSTAPNTVEDAPRASDGKGAA